MIRPSLLRPTALGTPDPFASICIDVEAWIKLNRPDYMDTWSSFKNTLLRRILRLKKKSGAYLRDRALAAREQSDVLGSTLMSLYEMTDSSVYYTSDYWRAFTYWLDKGKFNPRWPQFGRCDAGLACDLLDSGELETMRQQASRIWDMVDEGALSRLIVKVRPKIAHMCRTRIWFLSSYDPALYSQEDLTQDVTCAVINALRKCEIFRDDPEKMVGWVIKSADNMIHNIRTKALAGKRTPVIFDDLDDGRSCEREKHLSDCDMNLDDLLRVEMGDLDREIREVENEVCLEQLLEKADPKIASYLRTICRSEYNSDFWKWFCCNEPVLAQRKAYIDEHPEAIGPYIQRHIGLPTWKLAGFLHQHLPHLKGDAEYERLYA